jgi:hypothetical protein
MSSHGGTEARKIHDRLKHPILDADGHWAEFPPLMREEFRRIGGDTAVEALDVASARIPRSLSMSVAERRHRRIGQEVEHGLLTDDDFRDFIFENAVRFWGEVNPDFFKGTVVEKRAAEVLAQGR